MSLWVKICGNTSLEDTLVAAEAGADAVGFVFARSPRQVTREQVGRIISKLPTAIEKIGVFVDSTFGEVDGSVRECNLTGIQLHFDGSERLSARLRERFGPALRILRVAHYGTADATMPNDSAVDAVLIDSRTTTAVGGTGVPFDWRAAADEFRAQNMPARIVIAGGLSPENVEEAIVTLHPWGVDVVSGVEAAPGRKDPDKVRSFIARARAAATCGNLSKPDMRRNS